MKDRREFKPRILGFLCNWCCYAGADLAGVSRVQYPPHMRVIRVMCTGRVDLSFMLQAFSNGADGVFVGGCWPGECHYVTEGNYLAMSTIHICKKLVEYIGLSPERVRLEWVSASEGIRFAKLVDDFTRRLKELGPVGKGEGISQDSLKSRLLAVRNLVPYIKLVERERLRVRFDTEEEYAEFFSSEGVDRLFHELIGEELIISHMMLLLRERPLSTGEISEALDLDPSQVSRYLSISARRGLVNFDEGRKRFSPACAPRKG
ncbi:MAG: hydrogenase iron-sulfur subunit [Deltaproteobacteria bacterium]|nr:hydrogenase iron-sulfur subunit [Deltaproteobacteria bacterium]